MGLEERGWDFQLDGFRGEREGGTFGEMRLEEIAKKIL
jgi:hypothetical protein